MAAEADQARGGHSGVGAASARELIALQGEVEMLREEQLAAHERAERAVLAERREKEAKERAERNQEAVNRQLVEARAGQAVSMCFLCTRRIVISDTVVSSGAPALGAPAQSGGSGADSRLVALARQLKEAKRASEALKTEKLQLEAAVAKLRKGVTGQSVAQNKGKMGAREKLLADENLRLRRAIQEHRSKHPSQAQLAQLSQEHQSTLARLRATEISANALKQQVQRLKHERQEQLQQIASLSKGQ